MYMYKQVCVLLLIINIQVGCVTRDTTKYKERHHTITKRPLHHEEIPFLTGYATNLPGDSE